MSIRKNFYLSDEALAILDTQPNASRFVNDLIINSQKETPTLKTILEQITLIQEQLLKVQIQPTSQPVQPVPQPKTETPKSEDNNNLPFNLLQDFI